MGEGFKRLFVMLFYIFHPHYRIVLLEEPELHLHPSLIKRFLKILRDEQFNTQIFLTTHSPVFIQPNLIEHIWRVMRDDMRNTKVYYLSSSDTHLALDRLTQELNADNTEMFFADKVLLVEGVSDRILMRGLRSWKELSMESSSFMESCQTAAVRHGSSFDISGTWFACVSSSKARRRLVNVFRIGDILGFGQTR